MNYFYIICMLVSVAFSQSTSTSNPTCSPLEITVGRRGGYALPSDLELSILTCPNEVVIGRKYKRVIDLQINTETRKVKIQPKMPRRFRFTCDYCGVVDDDSCEEVDCPMLGWKKCERGERWNPHIGCCGQCVKKTKDCSEESRLCPDGVTSVTRDPANHCKFSACPKDNSNTRKPNNFNKGKGGRGKKKRDDSNKVKRNGSNKGKRDNSNKVKRDNSNKDKRDNSNKVKRDNSNKVKRDNSNKVKRDNSNKVKRDSNKVKRDDSNKKGGSKRNWMNKWSEKGRRILRKGGWWRSFFGKHKSNKRGGKTRKSDGKRAKKGNGNRKTSGKPSRNGNGMKSSGKPSKNGNRIKSSGKPSRNGNHMKSSGKPFRNGNRKSSGKPSKTRKTRNGGRKTRNGGRKTRNGHGKDKGRRLMENLL